MKLIQLAPQIYRKFFRKKSYAVSWPKSKVIKMIVIPLSFALAFGCSSPDNSSSGTSVGIDQTSVKNQGFAGICWSYALIAFIEQEHLQRRHTHLDLSEEAVAFYRTLESVRFLVDIIGSGDADIVVLDSDNLLQEGHYLKLGKLDPTGGLGLIRQFGVVPESEWGVKFTTPNQFKGILSQIQTKLKSVLNESEPENITDDFLIREVLVGPGRFPSAPPKILSQGLSPKEYLAKEVAFNPDAYESVSFEGLEKYPILVNLIKKTLASGQSVPLSFPVDREFFAASYGFSGIKSGKLVPPESFHPDAGHAVVITDWVNNNGQPGPLPPEMLQNALNEPAEKLDFIVTKNSWGDKDAGKDLPNGYLRIDRDYLKLALAAPLSGGLKLILPKAIAYEMAPDVFPELDPEISSIYSASMRINERNKESAISLSLNLFGQVAPTQCVLIIGDSRLTLGTPSADSSTKSGMVTSYQTLEWQGISVQENERQALQATAKQKFGLSKRVYVQCRDTSRGTVEKIPLEVFHMRIP